MFRFLLYYSMLFLTAFTSCTEFNQPVKPVVTFSGYERDSESGTTFEIYNDCYFEIKYPYNIDINGQAYITILLKKRNQGEYSMKTHLQESMDYRIEMRIENSSNATTVAFCSIYTTNNQSIYNFSTYMDNNKYFKFSLDPGLFPDLDVFFWQVEFYVSGNIKRLPAVPALWSFKRL